MTHPAAMRPFHPSPAVRLSSEISDTAMLTFAVAESGEGALPTRWNSSVHDEESEEGWWRRRWPGALPR